MLAATLAAVGLGTGGATARDERSSRSRELTLSQQVGQLVLLRFKGTTLPDYVRDAVRKRRVAGAILFGDNVTSPGQLRALTASLRREGGRPIVAVDQEGGAVRIIPWAPPAAGAREQAATGTVRASAQSSALALRSVGITVTLAPVADVPSVPDAALASRSFSSDSRVASNAMSSAVRGWRAGGVASTAKHFPGLGAARVNTDDASVTIRRSRSELEARDLPPFGAAIRAGVPLVMVGHARYPALDPLRIASQSPVIIEDLLRNRLGFRGAVVTDSMEAQASLATGGHSDRVRARRACGRRPRAADGPRLVRPGLPAAARRRSALAGVPGTRAGIGRPRAGAQSARCDAAALSAEPRIKRRPRGPRTRRPGVRSL